jgi:hypothetical protein
VRTAGLRPGTVVKVNKLGRVFLARLTGEPTRNRVPIKPLSSQVTYLTARPREIREVVGDPEQLALRDLVDPLPCEIAAALPPELRSNAA